MSPQDRSEQIIVRVLLMKNDNKTKYLSPNPEITRAIAFLFIDTLEAEMTNVYDSVGYWAEVRERIDKALPL